MAATPPPRPAIVDSLGPGVQQQGIGLVGVGSAFGTVSVLSQSATSTLVLVLGVASLFCSSGLVSYALWMGHRARVLGAAPGPVTAASVGTS